MKIPNNRKLNKLFIKSIWIIQQRAFVLKNIDTDVNFKKEIEELYEKVNELQLHSKYTSEETKNEHSVEKIAVNYLDALSTLTEEFLKDLKYMDTSYFKNIDDFTQTLQGLAIKYKSEQDEFRK